MPGPAENAQAEVAPVSAALLARALDTVSEASLITDAKQNVLYANQAFEAVTGYSQEEILGRNCRILQGPGSDPETVLMMRAVLGRGETLRCEILNYRKNGTPFWNGLTISALRGAAGSITHFVSVQRDITSQKTLQEQLQFMALNDPVTGLPNRTALEQYLSQTEDTSAGLTAVGIIDLDDFKTVNDRHGHETGDVLLAKLARRLGKRTRDQDFLAHLGGDEFVVVITGLSPEDPVKELSHIAEALHDAVDTNFTLEPGVRVRAAMSMGLALWASGPNGGNAALRRADAALYRLKARKGDRDKWWHLEDRIPTGERTLAPAAGGLSPNGTLDSPIPALVQEYKSRLFDGGLVMYYQPIMDLRTHQIHCAEALTRLVLGDGTVVPAGTFLPHLNTEDTNALLRAGLDQVLGQLTAWDGLGYRLNVSVNLSPSTLLNPDCTRWVATALNRYNFPPERLTFELLETSKADDEAQQRGIHELLELGVGLALDDLGSGHSTLRRLTALPFKTVKIDRQLLHQFSSSPVKTMTFLSSMVSMGQDMGWAMVAEGLENADLTEAVRILGIPYGQGFHLAKPMPGDNIPDWITKNSQQENTDLITTYAGALAYHWQFTRLKTPHTHTLQSCPLTPFLTKHAKNGVIQGLHGELHSGRSHYAPASEELLQWMVNNVTDGQRNKPILPFRQPALLGRPPW
ncbi:EAL domain-containing protein [Arthrobacter sp. ISL-85]|uniref:putative bifunctional diguanylate cyclase/phosphodiesterase n=1 Tax=Arthrobacter sp. ISL-85 TaxID=2819115 RepID=UPI00288C1451|nr:EAL domain-containing protein [Arthrobacter sp. ISL-85]